MMDNIKNKKNHGIVIFEDSIKALSTFILPFLIGVLPAIRSGKLGGIIVAIVIFSASAGLSIIYSVAEWALKKYSIENGVFTLKYGVFVKKNREIPVNKIITIHEMQTLSQRIFRVWTLKLDTGSSSLKDTEVKIVVSQQDLDFIRGLLKRCSNVNTDEEEEKTNNTILLYKAQPKSLIKMGLTSNAILAGFALMFSMFQFLSDFFKDKIDELLGIASDYIKTSAYRITIEQILLLLLIMIVYFVFSSVAGAIASLVKYHDFKVFREENRLTIQYGLLKRNSFTVSEDRINAVYVKQIFLRQITGLASIHIESIGYGNEKGEEAILVPLVKLNEANKVLMNIFADFKTPVKNEQVPKRSLRKFIIGVVIFPLLLIIPLSIFYPYGFFSFILLPFFLLSGILQYKNSGISWDNKTLFMNFGGYTRIFAQIKRKGIQAVIKKATPFQKAARLFSLDISIHGTVFGKSLAVKHLDDCLSDGVEDLV